MYRTVRTRQSCSPPRSISKKSQAVSGLGIGEFESKNGMQGMLGTYTLKGLKLPSQYASNATSAVTLVSALVEARLIISS